MSHFVRDLPRELLSLTLHWPLWNARTTPTSLYRFATFSFHLEHFSYRLGALAASLGQVICNMPKDLLTNSGGVDELVDHQLLKFDRILSLKNLYLVYNDTLALLVHFKLLKSLDIEIKDMPSKTSPIQLPPNLEELHIKVDQELDVSLLCAQVPRLTSLHARILLETGIWNRTQSFVLGELPSS